MRRALLAALAAAASGSLASAQALDELWTVSVNGQTVQVNQDGSFLIPNVSAADSFGPGGPGTSPDFKSDQLFRVMGVSQRPDGTTQYATSSLFQLVQSQLFLVGDLTITSVSPVVGRVLELSAQQPLLEVGQSLQLSAIVRLSDDTEVDATADAATTYQTSNLATAGVNSAGLVTGNAAGLVFITAINQGIADTIGIDVVDDTVATTVVGFVVRDDGTPVSGADLKTNYGGSSTSAADGSFAFAIVAPAGEGITVFGDAVIGGINFVGASDPAVGFEAGFTDVGLVILSPGYFGPLFGNPQFDVPGSPVKVAHGDVDGDGDRDAAVMSSTSALVTVLANNGEGMFLPLSTVVVGLGPTGISLGDLDDDSDLDLLVSHGTAGTAGPYLNDGDGSFSPGIAVATGLAPSDAGLADLDNDGDLDAVVPNAGSATASALLNDGVGGLGPNATYAAGPAPRDVALGDLNGDGAVDAAVANDQPAGVLASILLGDALGGFAPPGSFGPGGRGKAVALVDLDADLVPDLAVANPDADAVALGFGVGDGSFAAPVLLSGLQDPWSVAATDLDGIQGPDLLVANHSSSDRVSVHLNDGLGGMAPPSFYRVGSLPADVAALDLDGDDAEDSIVAHQSGNSMTALFGTGAGTLATFVAAAVGGDASSVAAGDLDGDLDPEVIATDLVGDRVAILSNNGDGTFAAPVFHATGLDPRSVAVTDLDLDFDFDLVVANSNGSSLSVLFNDGLGSFTAGTPVSVAGSPFVVRADDVDGDTDVDLVVLNAAGTVIILVNQGTGVFTPQATLPAGVLPLSMTLGDLSGDGLPDVANTSSSLFGGDAVTVHLNAGGAAFVPPVLYGTGGAPETVRMGDLDADGFLDLAVANTTSHDVSVLLNDGNGTFALDVTFATGTNPQSIAVGDYDGDGDEDLAVTARLNIFAPTAEVSLLLNNGNGTFGNATTYGAELRADDALALDYDLDGDVDLATANSTTGSVSTHPNLRIR